MQTQSLSRPPSCTADDGAERLPAMVVALGVRDARGRSSDMGRVTIWASIQARLAGVGVPRPQPLADPRLEALRRFAHATAEGRVTESERHDMALAGFSADSIAMAASMARALALADPTSSSGA